MVLNGAECDQGLLVFAQEDVLDVVGSTDFRVGHCLGPLVEAVGEEHLKVLLASYQELPELLLLALVCRIARPLLSWSRQQLLALHVEDNLAQILDLKYFIIRVQSFEEPDSLVASSGRHQLGPMFVLLLALALGDEVHDDILALRKQHDPDFVLLDSESRRTELHLNVVKWVTLELLILLNCDVPGLLNQYRFGSSPVECNLIFHTRAMRDLGISKASQLPKETGHEKVIISCSLGKEFLVWKVGEYCNTK